MKENKVDLMAKILAEIEEIKKENKNLKAQFKSNASNGDTVFANLSKSGKSWICDLDEIISKFGSGKLYIQKTTRKLGEHAGAEILTIKKIAGSEPDSVRVRVSDENLDIPF